MPEFGLMIRGAKGTIKVDDTAVSCTLHDSQPKNWYRQNLDDHVTYYLGDSEYYRENDCFIKSIILNEKSEPCFQTASEVDHLFEQIRSKVNEQTTT